MDNGRCVARNAHSPWIVLDCNGPLAQLVEQRTFNPLVAGSNPARPTIESTSYEHL